MADRFERFTERARKVLTLAQEEAHRFNHDYIGTEHLLLGLVREGDGVAARVLATMGVDLPAARRAVEAIVGRGQTATAAGEVGLTPRAKRALELAVDEARRLNHHYVNPEHLLLGLMRVGEGAAAAVLESLGASPLAVRREILRVVGAAADEAGTPEGVPQRLSPAGDFAEAISGRAVARPLVGLGVALASVLASLLVERRPRLAASLLTGAIAGLLLSATRVVLPTGRPGR